MSRPVPGPSRRAPLHPMTALGCAVVSVGLLLLLPAVAAEPELGPVPRPGDSGWWPAVAVLVAQALAVVWVARFPTAVLPGLAAAPLLLAWLTPGAAFSFGGVAELAGVFLAVVARPVRRLWPALVAAALVMVAGQSLSTVRAVTSDVPTTVLGALAQSLAIAGLPLLLGSVVAAQRNLHEARRQEVRALRREQDALLQAAVSRQRVAMSRELHDIAAHHMSGIAMMAAAVGRQIDSDPATAKQSARQIREQSRSVLDDLRRLVGLLRDDADEVLPMDALEAVSALVENRRGAGMEIDLRMPPGRGKTGAGPLAQLVAYRVVQESLANAAAHAPGARCAVEITEPRDHRFTVTVRNGPPTGPDPGPGGGFGLVGMAERAQLVGAELTYGATREGGWEVRLTLPEEDAADTMRAPARPPEDAS
ncbi:hypothetical protein GCM10027445_20240 [Amycolatopsis endophytica]|uniref:histidine kinase n=1 Tax=Amycolatopsis endophytica TaxID=860233 RepID=A0A853BEH8_9PSEU|nr:histidine kinase [Amycolatopsis endophytica]NYI93082.1 signal transduction histidine kinase [Amycolatopsis endophytica]